MYNIPRASMFFNVQSCTFKNTGRPGYEAMCSFSSSRRIRTHCNVGPKGVQYREIYTTVYRHTCAGTLFNFVHFFFFNSRHTGTGASCIYPLLGTSLNDWKFLATEIDENAVRYARENVSRNGLHNKIEGNYRLYSYLVRSP